LSRKAVFFFLMMVTAPGGLLRAQTAAEMDDLLASGEVTAAQASRFVLAAADVADESPEAAYALAREKGWLPKKAAPDQPVRVGELCFLLMNAFDIPGSFLYALFPGPRYAFREFEYLRLLPGRRDPGLRVSGEELLLFLTMTAAYRETEPALWEPPAAEPARRNPAAEQAQAAVREQAAEALRRELLWHEVADTSVRVAEDGIVISLNNIQFLPDSVQLTGGEQAKLREIAAILSRYPGRKILVGGHTALAGSRAGRQQIALERAQAVADYLTFLQVRRAGEITVRAYGADRPLGDNATEEGQALNRRVEIILLDE
jgi:outer membrane protein OmpA-like peptidoglycan-associated protein